MAQLVASSEYTGSAPRSVAVRMNGALISIAAVFAVLHIRVRRVHGRPAEQFAPRLRSLATAGIIEQEFRSEAWVKDGRNFVNVGEVTPEGKLKRIRSRVRRGTAANASLVVRHYRGEKRET